MADNVIDNHYDYEKNDYDIAEIQDWLKEFPVFEEHDSIECESFEDFYKKISEEIGRSQGGDLSNELLEKIAVRLRKESDKEHIDSLFELLYKADIKDCFFFAQLGMSSYNEKNYVVAERAYRLAVKYCDEEFLENSYKNNLAYLIRRKEIEYPDRRNVKEIPLLLRQGVEKKDTFALINMALFWALERGGEDNWNLADSLISFVQKSDANGAFEWWKEVALKGDGEGYLVHLLLIRHGKKGSSPFGGILDLFKKAKDYYPDIPEKMQYIVTPYDGGNADGFIDLGPWPNDNISW